MEKLGISLVGWEGNGDNWSVGTENKAHSGSVCALGVFFAGSFSWLVQLCPHHTLQVVPLSAKTHSLVNYYF